MTKTKSTKRALLTSALALLMCVSMLIGSTFAWFTDSVTSGRNKIVSGNLDVVLEYKTPDSQDEWKEVTSDTVLFGEKGLWEPGHTEVVALRIRNAGTLALKYDLATTVYEEVAGTNVYGDSFKLSDHLEIGYSAINGDGQIGDIFMGMMLGSRDNANSLTNSEFGKSVDNPYPIIMPGDAHVCALAISMPTTVGNEANYKTGTDAPFISFGVTLLATQATVESDSFNNQYDKDADYTASVGTADELKAALAAGGNIVFGSDIKLDKMAKVTEAATIDLANSTLTAEKVGGYDDVLAVRAEGVTLKNGTVKAENGYAVTVGHSGKTITGALTIESGEYYGCSTVVQLGYGELIIKGGYFEAIPYNGSYEYTINCIDTSYNNGTAKVTIIGGTFFNFDPSNNASEGAGTNYVPDGYKVISEQDSDGNTLYTVVAE